MCIIERGRLRDGEVVKGQAEGLLERVSGGEGGIWAQQLVGGLAEPRALSEPLLNW